MRAFARAIILLFRDTESNRDMADLDALRPT